MTLWWRRSLGGQIVGLMLVALIVGQAIGFVISWSNRRYALQEAAQSEFISRTATLAEVVQTMPPDVRRNVLLGSATTFTRFWTTPTDPKREGRIWYVTARAYLLEPLSNIINSKSTPETLVATDAQIKFVQNKDFVGWSNLDNSLWKTTSPVSVLPFEGLIGMGLVVQLPDGSWLNAVFHQPPASDIGTSQSLISTIVTALVLCLIGIISARRIAKPLRALADTAEALGRGEEVSVVPERGPDDIRHLYMAFNRMQQRLHRFLDDRTRMLAAIGHDLRTPLTTLRLRVEFVSDADLRQQMTATLDEMQSMTNATLSFAKGEATVEKTRNVDLSALVESLCDDIAELGHDIVYVDKGNLNYRCRPDGIKRAVRNLIENAVRYAGKAKVSLNMTEKTVEILVEDQGPGIPANEVERVFTPFYRLEQSRSRETGGVGLGLSIARAIARHHGGDIVLKSNDPGLHAALVLPRN